MRATLLIFLCLLAALPFCFGDTNAEVALNGNEVTIQPYAISFKLPLEWIQREQSQKTKFYLTQKDLASLARPNQGWTKLFSPVLDAVIPYKDAVLQVGREPWEDVPVWVYSLHLRVYVTDVSTKALWARLASDGLRILEAQSPRFMPHPSLSFAPFQKHDFSAHTKTTMTRMTFEFEYQYEDVGGRLEAALYAKDLKDKTVVFVFLPVLAQRERGQITEPLKDYTYILDSLGGVLKNKL